MGLWKVAKGDILGRCEDLMEGNALRGQIGGGCSPGLWFMDRRGDCWGLREGYLCVA